MLQRGKEIAASFGLAMTIVGVLRLFYTRRSRQEPTVRDNSVKSIKKAVLNTSP